MSTTSNWFVKRPVLATVTVTFTITALFMVLIWWAIGGNWSIWTWIACWLMAINPVTLLTYGYDKRQAMKEAWRIPEATLFALSACGGSFGAFLAMRWFRHKTVKGTFRVIFWLIVAMQVALIAWIIKVQITS